MGVIIENARKIDSDGVLDHFWVRFEESRIVETGTGRPTLSLADTVVNARGKWLTPGFIDLHCHGGGGRDFAGGISDIAAGIRIHRRHGTTRTVISLLTDSIKSLSQGLENIAKLSRVDPLILGSHLEGPFLSQAHKGAHDSEFLQTPTKELLETLLSAADGTLIQVTMAPELPGAMAGIDNLVSQGVRVAIGHTSADYRTTHQAFDCGATILTHAFNAMPPIHHRNPGPLMAAFEDDRVTLELILDGHHVHSPLARLAFREAKGRIALVSDAIAAAGNPDGTYSLGARGVTVEGRQAFLSGSETLAGSTLTQDAALRYAIQNVGLDPVEAVEALTSNPARALGRQEHLGKLRTGYFADAVMLSADWDVEHVWAGGVSQTSLTAD